MINRNKNIQIRGYLDLCTNGKDYVVIQDRLENFDLLDTNQIISM